MKNKININSNKINSVSPTEPFDKFVAGLLIIVWIVILTLIVIYYLNPYLFLDISALERKNSSHRRNVHAISIANTGDLNGALDVFKDALEIYPDNPETYLNMGVTYKKFKQYASAVECFNKAIEFKTLDVHNAYNNLYDIANDQKDSVKALEYYQKSLEATDHIIAKYMQKATFYFNKQIWDSSLANYMQAYHNRLQIKTQYYDMLITSKGNYDHRPEVVSNIDSIIKAGFAKTNFTKYDTISLRDGLYSDKRLALNLNRIGYCLAKIENFESALTYFKEALKIDPNYSDALANVKTIESILKKSVVIKN